MPIILENIIAEDRIDKIRIVNENDDVIGGQPELSGMSENDNNGLLDIACTLKKAQKDIEKQSTNITENYIHKDNISSDLNSNRTDYIASEKSAHDINKKAISAQNTANTAVTNASTAQNRADSAYALADKKIDKTSIANTLGNSTTLVASQKLVNDVSKQVAEQGLGYGQSWVDVTSERVEETTYTNNTEKPIQISVSIAGAGAGATEFKFFIDDVEIVNINEAVKAQSVLNQIIPRGSEYKVVLVRGSQIFKWGELR